MASTNDEITLIRDIVDTQPKKTNGMQNVAAIQSHAQGMRVCVVRILTYAMKIWQSLLTDCKLSANLTLQNTRPNVSLVSTGQWSTPWVHSLEHWAW